MENNKNKTSFYYVVVAVIATVSSLCTAGSYPEVWQATQQGAYKSLPQHETTKASFFSNGINLIAKAANRTLTDEKDVLPYFQKLVHPIGICFSGTWKITQKSPYSGYFATGSEGLIIMRASEAMGKPNKGDYRAFGLAGKIFPTTDIADQRDYKTANFFTVDDLGGTTSQSFFELAKSNAPPSSVHASTIFSLGTISAIVSAFKKADSNPTVRQLYPISELGLSNPADAVTPKGMMLTSDIKSNGANAPVDFRNELRVSRYPGQKLSYGINVSDKTDGGFRRIGTIELTEDSLSEGCDHILHFPHPRWRN